MRYDIFDNLSDILYNDLNIFVYIFVYLKYIYIYISSIYNMIIMQHFNQSSECIYPIGKVTYIG